METPTPKELQLTPEEVAKAGTEPTAAEAQAALAKAYNEADPRTRRKLDAIVERARARQPISLYNLFPGLKR